MASSSSSAVGANGEALVIGSRVRIDGLASKPELNGSFGTLLNFSDNGRCNVKPDEYFQPLALKPEALAVVEGFEALVIGTRVRVGGLSSKPELNGKLGTVQGFSGEDRCSIRMDGGEVTVALKPDALVIAEDAGASCKGGGGESKVVRVECNEVALKLTLTPKLLKKPLIDAVIRPYLKAYNKKQGANADPVEAEHVVRVTIDSEGQTALKEVTDIRIFPAENYLKDLRGDIDVEVFLGAKKEAPST